jgi:hypothetical protein
MALKYFTQSNKWKYNNLTTKRYNFYLYCTMKILICHVVDNKLSVKIQEKIQGLEGMCSP